MLYFDFFFKFFILKLLLTSVSTTTFCLFLLLTGAESPEDDGLQISTSGVAFAGPAPFFLFEGI